MEPQAMYLVKLQSLCLAATSNPIATVSKNRISTLEAKECSLSSQLESSVHVVKLYSMVYAN